MTRLQLSLVLALVLPACLDPNPATSLALAQITSKGLYVGFHSREHSSARPRLELIPLRGKVRPIKAVASASKAASGTAA